MERSTLTVLLRRCFGAEVVVQTNERRVRRGRTQLSREELWGIGILLVVMLVLFSAALAGHVVADLSHMT